MSLPLKTRVPVTEDEGYRKAREMVRSHATGYCLRQDKVSCGPYGSGLLEMHVVGKSVVAISALPGPKGDRAFVEIWVQATVDNRWESVEAKLAELAE